MCAHTVNKLLTQYITNGVGTEAIMVNSYCSYQGIKARFMSLGYLTKRGIFLCGIINVM
jgi:uncharacterized membrane protein